MKKSRREFLRRGGRFAVAVSAGGLTLYGSPASCGGGSGNAFATSHALSAPDVNGVRLPVGFHSSVVARSGRPPVTGSEYKWHAAPDGGATFAQPDGGWIYVSNSELTGRKGGVGALRFDTSGQLAQAYNILSGTQRNCAGGATPWGTWLSCEEVDDGQVWECDPTGRQNAQVLPAMGTFAHEAVAVDPLRGHVYLTEDQPDSLLYRFTPKQILSDGRMELTQGVLAAMVVAGTDNKTLVWQPIPDPLARRTPTRKQLANGVRFDGGEGLVYESNGVYFTTKGDNRVWRYDILHNRLIVHYSADRYTDPVLTGVDNLALGPRGILLVAEDGGDLQLVALTPAGKVVPLLQLIGHERSEVTGPAFDPSGRRLYFSSQRGMTGRDSAGVTYEITGPFKAWFSSLG